LLTQYVTTCGNFTKFTTWVQLRTKMNGLDFEVRRSKSRSQRDHIWSNKYWLDEAILAYLRNAWTYFNKTYHCKTLNFDHP